MKFRKTGLVAMVATAVCAMLLGSGTASAAATNRLANLAAKQCIVSELNGNIHSGLCTPVAPLRQWIWSGKLNGISTIRNSGTGYCLDSNAAGNAYTLPCNGSDNQNWLVIQRAAGSALLLQNIETRRYLYQNSSNLYSTTDKLDLNAKVLRWTIG
jgi:hypothetical protein